jgi:membrane-associated phospholipid phosphatase
MSERKTKPAVVRIRESAHSAARAQSAPPHARRRRAVLFQVAVVIIAAAVSVLMVLVKTTASSAIDLRITKAIQTIDFPPFASVMIVVSWPGSNPQSAIIAALIVLLIFAFGLHWEALMAIIAGVFTTSVNLLVKALVQRPRPASSLVKVFAPLDGFSFPSGHVMFYIGFFGFIGFLAFHVLKPSTLRTLILAFIGAMVALIGVSRMYLGAHWASDVLGAYLLGSLALAAIIQVFIWGKSRFFVRQPVAPVEPEKP